MNKCGKPPALIRTSRLSSDYIKKNLDTINVPIRLLVEECFHKMTLNWTRQEKAAERRIVLLQISREDLSTFRIKCSPVAQGPVEPDESPTVISCIRWEENGSYVVTSVDVLLILEALVGEQFSVEEKSRIRRNLQFLKPDTVTRASNDRLFNSIMAMENPRPRNIEKDLKVFKWENLTDAVNKVLSKYSANPAASGLSSKFTPGPISGISNAMGCYVPTEDYKSYQGSYVSLPWSMAKARPIERQPRPRQAIEPVASCLRPWLDAVPTAAVF